MKNGVKVKLAERSYDIVIGDNLVQDLGRLMVPLIKRPRVAVILDENVRDDHLPKLLAGLERSGIAHDWLAIESGESSKSWDVLRNTVEWLIETGIERQDLVISFGGGVVGDLAGFASAIARRGIRCVQVPTTLLAQVDSSVGGKTGINSRSGKNLVGVFSQPVLVVCDIALLRSLPHRAMLSGYGEVAKYGLLGDAEFFEWLEKFGPDVVSGVTERQVEAVRRSCKIKAGIVAMDETEQGHRALLNLGHTFAHAFETDSGYSDELLHGEAVAVGCCLAFDLSHEIGYLGADIPQRVRRHFRSMGMCTDIRQLAVNLSSAERIVNIMRQDKKVVDGKPRFVVARDIGQTTVVDDVSAEKVLRVLRRSANPELE